jgi:hypothetical protein
LPGDRGDLGDMAGIADGNRAERLNALGDEVDKLELLTGMLVQQQVQLVKSVATHEPVMLLVQAVQNRCVGEDMVTDRRFTASPFSHFTESDQSVFLKLATPGQHGRTRHPDHLADFRIRHPSAANSNTWVRCTTRCAALRDLTKVSRTSRCPSDIANGAAARLIHHSIRH